MDLALHEDAAAVLNIAGEFLESEPVHHNLILTLLHTRASKPEPGRYWIGRRGGSIAGLVFHSPPRVPALITPLAPAPAAAMARAIADAGVSLPGISGEAAAAAAFAGQWAESTKSPAVPFAGQRLYELGQLQQIAAIRGRLRRAGRLDRDMLVEWVIVYQAEVHEDIYDPARVVDRWLGDGRIWLWDRENAAVCMAVARERVAGVTRIGGVFTPAEHRRNGYAGACVHALSKSILDEGARPILYTDLANTTSNAIYRRIGFRAVGEAIRYRFG